jgi:CheY-like chemotaxis protein/HPt (histidine-containing phosphotransfer) domain-containing protein
VAFIDTDLRGNSGLAFSASLKGETALAGLRVVLLASPRTAADPVQRREAGAACQLVKPPRLGDLVECLLQRAPAGAKVPAPRALPELAAHPQAPAASGSPLRRRRALLAEDNPVNVEVATAMLDSLGFDVHHAANGEAALQAVQGGGVEIVLMDCQMPVMDGFKATAEIRRHEQQQGRPRKLPIVAITANALQGDREACLAAGMDDYLSKPYSQQQLAAVIGRWIQLPVAATVHHGDYAPLPQAVAAPAPSWAPHREAQAHLREPDVALRLHGLQDEPLPGHDAPGAQDQHDPINPTALANIRALSSDRGDALVRKVVSAYVDDTPQHLDALRRAISGNDVLRLRKEAHSLKSSSANVGAETLAQMCKEMEHLGRTETTEGAAGILTHMELEFQAVRHTLTAILEKEA